MFGPKRDEVETGGHYTVRNSVGWSVSQSVSLLVNSVGKGPSRVDIYSGVQEIPFL
jgi:hypothetical protein